MNKLIVISARWCRPCVELKKQLKEFNETHEPQIEYDVIDVEENPDLVARYNIESVPVLVFRYADSDCDYFVSRGTATIEQILDMLKR